MIIISCLSGEMGVLPGHMPFSAALDIGALRIRNGGEERIIAVYGGIAEIKDDVITILTDMAQWPEDIDSERARADRADAESRLPMDSDDAEMQIVDRVALRRALVQIEVSAYPIIRERDY